LLSAPKELEALVRVIEFAIGEITQHGLIRGDLHREVVMRPRPVRRRARMTAGALGVSYKRHLDRCDLIGRTRDGGLLIEAAPGQHAGRGSDESDRGSNTRQSGLQRRLLESVQIRFSMGQPGTTSRPIMPASGC
jgi:hypothetical protein